MRVCIYFVGGGKPVKVTDEIQDYKACMRTLQWATDKPTHLVLISEE